MTAEIWLLIVLGAVIALVLGFFVGRRSAPTQQRLDAMEKERDEARQEADRVQGEVARHFEQSAQMFGRLADDYRTFFEHFAQTAQHLGLSEGRARELLQQADPRLVADQSSPAEPTAASGADHAAPATPTGGERDDRATESPSATAEESAAEDTPGERSTAGEPAAPEPAEAEETRGATARSEQHDAQQQRERSA